MVLLANADNSGEPELSDNEDKILWTWRHDVWLQWSGLSRSDGSPFSWYMTR